MREILFFEPKTKGTNLRKALQTVGNVVHRRSIVFVLSDFQAENYQTALGSIARRHDVVAMPLTDPREETLPNMGTVRLQDAETGELMEVATGRASVREAYAEAVRERGVKLRAIFKKNRLDVVNLRTDTDWVPALSTFFRTREHRLGGRL